MDSCFENDIDRWVKLEQLIVQAENENGILVINFHTNNFDEVEFPAYKHNYMRIIEILKERGAEFMTMREVYKREVYKKVCN